MKNRRPVALIILDGIGLSGFPEGDATKMARTPTIDWLWANCPHARLQASGEAVGLMEGQMGDSNVGHLNLGAGRIVYQYVALISKSIREGDFFQNEQLLQAVNHAKKHGTKLHLMGLVSPGGVHSHSTHLYALLKMAKDHGLEKVYVHAFLDGRDVPPSSAKEYLEELEAEMANIGVAEPPPFPAAITPWTGTTAGIGGESIPCPDRRERAHRCIERRRHHLCL